MSEFGTYTCIENPTPVWKTRQVTCRLLEGADVQDKWLDYFGDETLF